MNISPHPERRAEPVVEGYGKRTNPRSLPHVLAVMVMMPAAIPMMVMMVMIRLRADPAHMVMVAGLGGADLVGVAEDPRAVLAKLAVHRRIAGTNLLDALGEGVEDAR